MNLMEFYDSSNQEMNIVHHLIMKSPFHANLGLMEGKMGIAIMFFLYSKKKNNKVYADFASELLDEIWAEIDVNLGVGFYNGLSGIGWGIEYLVQHGYVEGNTDEICSDIDSLISEISFSKEKDLLSMNELTGIWHYMSARLYSCLSNRTSFPFEKDFINEVKSLIFDKIKKYEWGGKTNFVLLHQMTDSLLTIRDNSYLDKPLGLNGLAGYIINSIS